MPERHASAQGGNSQRRFWITKESTAISAQRAAKRWGIAAGAPAQLWWDFDSTCRIQWFQGVQESGMGRRFLRYGYAGAS